VSAVIELDGVTRRFGAKVAVSELSLQITERRCWGLIGPNGAGKSTLFSLLCGFLRPSAGRVRVLGTDPRREGALRGRVGVLPQDAALPAWAKVGELLVLWSKLSGLGDPAGQARGALAAVGLAEAWAVRAGTLSHGMAKRVQLAQALLGDPPLLLLDEPTSGLDPRSAADVRALIRERRGRQTIVISSHNLQELEDLCDDAAILDRGKLLQAGVIAELTAQRSEFRVQIGRGDVPLQALRALDGCASAQLAPDGGLWVRFDGARFEPDEMITRTLRLLLDGGVTVSAVTRGRGLEAKVLEATEPPAG
jgi:ABC-2 type transport system ATP-binding protein